MSQLSTPSPRPSVDASRSTTSSCQAGGCSSSVISPGRWLNDIPRVSCTKPAGALYLFPRLDPEIFGIVDDQRFALDLLREQHPRRPWDRLQLADPDHFRIVTLPRVEVLTEAIGRLGEFLAGYRQNGAALR